MPIWRLSAVFTALLLPVASHAQDQAEIGALVSQALTEARPPAVVAAITDRAETEPAAAFGQAMLTLTATLETTAGALVRHGISAPRLGNAALMLGIPLPETSVEASVEPLSYAQLRAILESTLEGLDTAHDQFIAAAESGDFVVPVDVLSVKLDIDGDGTLAPEESIGVALAAILGQPIVPPGGKDKSGGPPQDLTIGFDTADAYWFAGYTQVLAAQAEFLLSHDFEEMFASSFHRIFPEAGLPMEDYSRGGMLMIDPDTDTGIADIIAFIHTFNLPVTAPERLLSVQQRLLAIVGHSRSNWDAILEETDDFAELVPSPSQTSLVPDVVVTDKVVAAWHDTLDAVEAVLTGDLLVPHWRFSQGIDADAYFRTAERTDFVMMLTGYDVLPFLADGPIADAATFRSGLEVFGDDFPLFAVWFN
jgi:hypothetical protein